MQLRWTAVLLGGLLISACTAQSTATPAPASTPVPTPAGLNRTVDYWDLGLRIKFPENWAAAQFVTGYMAIAPSVEAARGQIQTQPVVYARIADPTRDLKLPKDATLAQIDAALSGGPGVIVSGGGSTKVAGLDAAYVELAENNKTSYGRAFAFRMPDGRIGLIVGVTPADQWADFAPSLDQIRMGITLLKPSDFAVPVIGSGVSRLFPQASITIPLPDGWTDGDVGSTARIFRGTSIEEYVDVNDSGFANGPRLVLLSQKMPNSVELKEAFRQLLKIDAKETVQDVNVGWRPGVKYSYTDQASGQIVTFVGFQSINFDMLNVFRWSVPGILADATRPVFDKIVSGTNYYTTDGTLIPPLTPQPVATP